MRGGSIEQHDHAGARHEVAFAQRRDVRRARDERIDHVADLHRLAVNAQRVDDQLRVIEAVRRRGAIGHAHGIDVVRADGLRHEVTRQRRIDAARQAEDGMFDAHFADFIAQEGLQDRARQIGIDVQFVSEIRRCHMDCRF